MQIIVLFLCSFFITPLFAKVIDYQTDSFADIAARYQQLDVKPETTLMVFDLDDTLITTTQPLGGVGWWDWQYELLKSGRQEDKLFTKDYQQLVRIQNILFQLVKMEITDEQVLPFLIDSANQGAMLLGFTARSSEHLSATLTQLKDNRFFWKDKLIFKEKGLKLHDKTSLPGKVHCPQFRREVIYQQGIFFLSGEDKGEALSCVLSQSPQNVKTIVFVDDARRNTLSMHKAFEHRDDILVFNVLYNRENAKEEEVQRDPDLQKLLFQQWNAIKNNLHAVIENPTI